VERLGRGVLAAALAAVLVLSGPAGAETVTIPVADNPALFKVQKTLVEAWMILYETYVDPNFNHLDWHGELRSELERIAHAASLEDASKEVAGMINKLGDPFTRWVPPTEYADFRVSSDGELVGGVGLLVAQDPMSGRLVVLAPIKGSPADRAGIQPGDEVVSVNGTPTSGMNGEDAAHVLRGKQGSSVTVEVARPTSKQGAGYGEIVDASSDDAVPGVAALSPTDRLDRMERKQFKLRRERVELSPVFATTVNYDDHPFGYVRLVNFSQHAAHDMEKAISQLRKDGVEGFILDLRNNPGGLVKSALEVASLWLNGEARPTIFSVQDRDTTVEDQSQAVAPFPSDLLQSTSLKSNTEPAEEAVHRVVLLGGKAITDAPLVVLVNKQSASASEILAGALHDNKRAELVGGRFS
jgi:carboxyl-terminal processing protease